MQKMKVGAGPMESFYLLPGCGSNYKQVKVTGEVTVKNVQNTRFHFWLVLMPALCIIQFLKSEC